MFIFLIKQFVQINLNAIIYLFRLILIIIFLIFIYLDKQKQLIVKQALFWTVLCKVF
jgi:hypothetical protein